MFLQGGVLVSLPSFPRCHPPVVRGSDSLGRSAPGATLVGHQRTVAGAPVVMEDLADESVKHFLAPLLAYLLTYANYYLARSQ